MHANVEYLFCHAMVLVVPIAKEGLLEIDLKHVKSCLPSTRKSEVRLAKVMSFLSSSFCFHCLTGLLDISMLSPFMFSPAFDEI